MHFVAVNLRDPMQVKALEPPHFPSSETPCAHVPKGASSKREKTVAVCMANYLAGKRRIGWVCSGSSTKSFPRDTDAGAHRNDTCMARQTSLFHMALRDASASPDSNLHTKYLAHYLSLPGKPQRHIDSATCSPILL
jgi:hypothetical protein